MFSEKYFFLNLEEIGESLEFCHSKNETGKRKKHNRTGNKNSHERCFSFLFTA
jgi:hypothetical protein